MALPSTLPLEILWSERYRNVNQHLLFHPLKVKNVTFRYYLRHCLWGLVGCGALIYNILTDLSNAQVYHSYVPYMPYVAAYLTIGAVAYPFAYCALEASAQKIMSKKSWDRGFSDMGSSRSLFIFVYMFCIAFIIPLIGLYFYIENHKKR